MANRMNFAGTHVLITGGAQGIGLACAKAFVEHGANVTIADINADGCSNALDTLKSLGDGTVACFVADVRQPENCAQLVADAIAANGKLDVLVNNAGVVHAGDILNLDADGFDHVFSVNVRGAFLMAQAAARAMVEAGTKGSIINMSSVNSVVGLPNQLAYSMSKGALAQLTRAASIRLAPEGIRVNAIGPGSIGTEMLADALSRDPHGKGAILSRTPLGRLGEPSEVADVALYLASDYSSYITGETIYIDGGRLALGYTVPVKED
ncbi:SDR family NAD(P)-dependent oxidoreductase [uncultured Ruegeria sp.]|uniref:SDR family NAD(P)-dependent oxidoreductase n=1 Tax=uncultured Ruegeria sp. TaxID=259304 RepID=UPI00260483A6|nr:SDR family NAD(P)-dependent oxidoreductase [uncultured Ruegeria sp.]